MGLRGDGTRGAGAGISLGGRTRRADGRQALQLLLIGHPRRLIRSSGRLNFRGGWSVGLVGHGEPHFRGAGRSAHNLREAMCDSRGPRDVGTMPANEIGYRTNPSNPSAELTIGGRARRDPMSTWVPERSGCLDLKPTSVRDESSCAGTSGRPNPTGTPKARVSIRESRRNRSWA